MSLFQTNEYKRIFLKHFSQQEDIVLDEFERVGERAVLIGMKPVLGGSRKAKAAGLGEEVTDYGDIQEPDKWPEILKQLKDMGIRILQLDYVREDSGTYRWFTTLRSSKLSFEVMRQEVAPYIDLPKSFDDYLITLKRKHRKELKRKVKRLESENKFYQCSPETVEHDFEEFVRLHRLSDLKKRKFMSEKMKQFFWDIKTTKIPGWQSHLCFLKLGEKTVASVMTFESESEVWLYNSGYDPDYSYYSVGLLLKSYKIKKAIEMGKRKYDFLRGDERYKYELGAKDLKLYKIVVQLLTNR